MTILKQIIIGFFKFISKLSNNIINYYTVDDITMSKAVYSKSGRYLLYYVKNNKLKNHYDVLKLIFNRLKQDKDFLNFGKKKVMIVSAIVNDHKYSFHHNVLLTNNSTFDDYYNQIKDYITNIYEEGTSYGTGIDTIPMFELKIWNIDLNNNKNIKIHKNGSSKSRGYHTLSGFHKSTLIRTGFLNYFIVNGYFNTNLRLGLQLLHSALYHNKTISPLKSKVL